MRTLPDNPSLDYLKQEAKDMHDVLKDSDPRAKLSDAQRSLAQQYGFRTWTELRAEVERRREAAQPPDPELTQELARAFGLGKPKSPMVAVAREVMGHVYSLETESGRFSLKTVFDWMNRDVVEEGMRLREAAAKAGVKSPEPIRAPNGELLVEAAANKWRADLWMPLGPSPVLPVATSVASKVGDTLGTLHGLGLKSPGRTHFWFTHRPSKEDWDQLLGKARSVGAEWAPALEKAIPELLELSSIVDDSPEEPVLSHCNVDRGNVRLAKGESLVLLHWEFAGGVSPSWELGYVLAHWTMDPGDEVNGSAAKALVDAYRTASGSEPRADLTMFTGEISARLNWIAGRVGIALDGSDPDRQAHARRELPALLADGDFRAQAERLIESIG